MLLSVPVSCPLGETINEKPKQHKYRNPENETLIIIATVTLPFPLPFLKGPRTQQIGF